MMKNLIMKNLIMKNLTFKSFTLYNIISIITISILVLAISNATAIAKFNSNDIVGTWRTENGKGLIEIYKSPKGTYEGKVVGGEPRKDKNGNPITKDINNPDPTKRNNPTRGMVILTNFIFEDGEWTDGNVYNPEDGKDYSCKIWLDDHNTLNIRGYVGISLLGKTQKWTREK